MYLAALGPQMLRLAGEIADGALLNWATPERIAVSRERIDAGAARAGREPGAVPMTMYIRVCIDDDLAAARQAFGAQVLGYAMGQPGTPPGAGYRGLFAQMGFEAELTELEARRDQGAALPDLVDAAPAEMLQAVGYYGPAAAAPAAFARLSAGLDEAIVRIITARPGLEPATQAMAALTPALIRAAERSLPAASGWRTIAGGKRKAGGKEPVMTTAEDTRAAVRHPLDPLTGAEIEAATGILIRDRNLAGSARFVYVTLREPAKETVLAGHKTDREAHIVLRERNEHKTWSRCLPTAAATPPRPSATPPTSRTSPTAPAATSSRSASPSRKASASPWPGTR